MMLMLILYPCVAEDNFEIEKDEIALLFSPKVKENLKISFPINRVFKYKDKLGVHFFVIATQDVAQKEKVYTKKMKFYIFLQEKEKLKLEVSLYDFGENLNIDSYEFKDADSDGVIEPIVSYDNNASNNDFYKTFFFFKNKKIIYRNYQDYAKIDKIHWTLPFKIMKYLEPYIIIYDYKSKEEDASYCYYSYIKNEKPWLKESSLDEYKIFVKDSCIKIIYKDKICTIRHISSSLDCERYTKIDASFYRLPKIIQTRVLKLLTQMKSDTFLIDNDFKEDIKLHSLYLWDKSCLDFQIFKPWGERGIYPLKEEEIKSIIKARVRKKFDIKNSIPIVYKYRDKLGEQYLVIDSPYQSYSENYSKNMRIFNFIKKKNGLNLQWKLRDFSMNPIYVHMDNNMKDIDGDGLIDPIISYETESGFKIILFYKNRKIAIRANLEGDIEQLSINIDKRLYTIPFKIQEKVGKTIFNYVKIRSLPLAYAFDIKNRMKQKITRIKVNKMLLE